MELKTKKILIGTCSTVAIIGGLFYGYETAKKDIKIVTNKETKEISTFKYTIDEVIKEQGLKFDNKDIINLVTDGEKKKATSKETQLKDDMIVEIVDVSTGTISEYKETEFETKVVDDKSILKGKSVVSQEGENGKNSLLYDVVYHDGKLVEKNFSKEIVSKEPKDKIIKKGTKVVEEVVVATSRGSNSRKVSNDTSSNKSSNSSSTAVAASNSASASGRHMQVVATAYAGDTITATGTVPKWGTIAVDPRIIPYGTRVYIPQFGQTFIAEDCGGAIKGNKIDIFMNSENQAYDWGRRTIDIYIQG